MTASPSPPLTVVMYHFVRPLAATPFPRLTALDLAAFREQLAYITRHYTPVALSEVIAAANGSALPPRPIVLTFDDGYADHYRHVFPLLADSGVTAAFFPTSRTLIDRRMLDVNKIQFVLAAAESPARLVAMIEEAVLRQTGRAGIGTPETYRREGWAPTRYDAAEVAYVKRMLQRLLPEQMRSDLLDTLFAALVSGDEAGFAAELYFTVEQAREMIAAGMELGCHGDQHVMLTTLTRDAQAREIDGALRVLDVVGRPRQGFAYCYAKGDHNADSVDLLHSRGCAIALTTKTGLATVTPGSMLTVPRIDANDLPIDAAAPPNDWTLRAVDGGA